MRRLETALSSTGSTEVLACILCFATEGRPDSRWAQFLHLKDPFGVRRCPKCGLRWLSPRPTEQGYGLLYSSEFYFHSDDLVDYSEFAGQRRDHFVSRIRKLQGYFNRSPHLLDYGAATGEFVALARDHGITALGVEFSSDARLEAKQTLAVELLSPTEADALDQRFDAIHMNHVLEHMPNPATHLDWCNRMLVAGGILVIEVPNQFDNFADKLRRLVGRGGRQDQFDAFSLHHTYFFSRRTVSELCKQHGFVIRDIRTIISPHAKHTSLSRRFLELIIRFSNFTRGDGDAIEVYAEKAAHIQPISSRTMS